MSIDPRNRIAVVTGAARGIGLALGCALRDAGAQVVLTDVDAAAVTAAGAREGLHAEPLDVTDEAATAALIDKVEGDLGAIDIYCSNAGILNTDAPGWSAAAQSAQQWRRSFEVNVHAHVHACRALLPRMIERGNGAFVITASAAGLLSQTGDAAYSCTKHAAVGFAEALAIAHGDDGIHVSVLCPQGVDTAMLDAAPDSSATLDGTLAPAEVAGATITALREGRFLVLPHPKVAEYFNAKANDYERWVGGMRKLRRRQIERTGRAL